MHCLRYQVFEEVKRNAIICIQDQNLNELIVPFALTQSTTSIATTKDVNVLAGHNGIEVTPRCEHFFRRFTIPGVHFVHLNLHRKTFEMRIGILILFDLSVMKLTLSK